MKKIYLTIILFCYILTVKSQCMIDALNKINKIDGTCILYKELNNSGLNEISIVLKEGSYHIYLLNASHDITEYRLMEQIDDSDIPLIVDERSENYLKYKMYNARNNEYKFSVEFNVRDKACILLALFVVNDERDKIIEYAKSKSEAPEGTVRVSKNLFFEKTEVSNKEYGEFVFWNKKTYGENSREYLNSLPDTTTWIVKEKYLQPYVIYYFRHPAYSNYPVVGIRYEQANKYCEWLTDRLNEKIFLEKKKKEYETGPETDNIPTIFQYRLPTKQEWEMVTGIGISEKYKKIKAKDGNINANLRFHKGNENDTEYSSITAPVDSYFPNLLDIYNMIGNVAEMLQEKGIAKGGSWYHTEKEVSIKKDFMYDQPTNWLGFRCVCEKVSE